MLSWFLFFFISQVSAEDKKYELLFVQMVYRHGDRAPVSPYPTDPNPKSFWRNGLGELTMRGKREHYSLGRLFRSMYKNFMTTNPREINVTSSNFERCVESAETNLATFFAPTKEWKFEEDVAWQPIPIHIIPMAAETCPAVTMEELRQYNTSEGQKLLSDHEEMFKFLSSHSDLTITNLTSLAMLYDTLMVEKEYNLIIPDWAYKYWDEMEKLKHTYFYWQFKSTFLQRLRGGPFIKNAIMRMEQKIKGELPELKFEVFSGHDSNVAVILIGLNLYPMKTPPYCATLILELYKGPKDVNFIRLLYLNTTKTEKEFQEPHILAIEGCQEFCPLDYFINYTQPLIPDDWNKECRVS